MEDAFDAGAVWSRRLGGVLLISYLASRTLFPSEDAASGSGLYFLPLAYGCGLCLALERMFDVRGPAFGWFGATWMALLAFWYWSAMEADYRYPAEIMLLEWGGIAAVCLYARHRHATDGPHALASLAVALLLCESLYSGYQVFAEYPQRRERYAAGDPAFVEGMRRIGVEPGGPLETAFRNRLESNEPSGTTGHPNSLAGLCLLMLPLAALLAWSNLEKGGLGRIGVSIAIAIALLGTATLIATKSRSAWLGILGVLVVLAALRRREWNWRRGGFWIACAIFSVTVLAIVLTAAGLLDVLVITEAVKSLQYRWEWWRGSAGVIAEAPWLGVGAGSFGDYYLKHKLPFSSEEISDPHNFLIETWATGGLAALLAYLFVLALGSRNVLIGRKDWDSLPSGLGIDAVWWTGVGFAIVAVLMLEIGPVTALVTPGSTVKLACFLVAIFALGVMQWLGLSWSEQGVRHCVLAGVAGLHLHWLAAGGVAFPALSSMALGLLGASTREPNDPRPVPLWRSLLVASALSFLLAWMIGNWWLPRLQRDLVDLRLRRTEMAIGEVQCSPARQPVHSPPAVGESRHRLRSLYGDWLLECEQYTRLIPGDWGGWAQLGIARTRYAEFLAAQENARDSTEPALGNGVELQSAEAMRGAIDAWIEALTRAPRRAEAYWQLGHLYLQESLECSSREMRSKALRSLEEAIKLAPTNARRRWRMGEIYERLDQTDRADKEYQQALWLDRTPHLDRKLSEDERQHARRYLGETD